MLKIVLAACVVLCALTINADARGRHRAAGACIETGDVMRPVCGAASPSSKADRKEAARIARGNYIADRLGYGGVRPAADTDLLPRRRGRAIGNGASLPSPAWGMIARPARYIAGRLICARNVNGWLADRGIPGTGSALALSFSTWGRSAGGPVPGAVIVSGRRGGGHLAIVSRVQDGVVYAWNATGGQRGWREIPYRHHVIDYRVPL